MFLAVLTCVAAARRAPSAAPLNRNTLRQLLAREPGVVVVQPHQLKEFIKYDLPQLAAPCAIVISDDPWWATCESVHREDVEKILASPWVRHVWSENLWEPSWSPNVTGLPIGIRAKSWRKKPSEWTQVCANMRSFRLKMPVALANFHFNTRDSRAQKSGITFDPRGQAEDELRATAGGSVYFIPKRVSLDQCWEDHNFYGFEISPLGDGLDCHRTWEALLLQTVPIVKTSQLDPLYAGLPVVIVKSWSEVTDESLLKWARHFARTNWTEVKAKMTSAHWAKRIVASSALKGETRPTGRAPALAHSALSGGQGFLVSMTAFSKQAYAALKLTWDKRVG